MVRVVGVVVVVVVRVVRSKTISPHYRSEGRRQGSCAVLGGCLTLSADLAKSNAVFSLVRTLVRNLGFQKVPFVKFKSEL